MPPASRYKIAFIGSHGVGRPPLRVAQIVPPLTVREELLARAVGILEAGMERLTAP